MSGNEIKIRIDEINIQRTKFNSEIRELQERCKHEEYNIDYYSWRIGSMSIAKLCKFCYKNLGQPTTEELNNFNDIIGLLRRNNVSVTSYNTLTGINPYSIINKK